MDLIRSLECRKVLTTVGKGAIMLLYKDGGIGKPVGGPLDLIIEAPL
jgi:hypothetical protein